MIPGQASSAHHAIASHAVLENRLGGRIADVGQRAGKVEIRKVTGQVCRNLIDAGCHSAEIEVSTSANTCVAADLCGTAHSGSAHTDVAADATAITPKATATQGASETSSKPTQRSCARNPSASDRADAED